MCISFDETEKQLFCWDSVQTHAPGLEILMLTITFPKHACSAYCSCNNITASTKIAVFLCILTERAESTLSSHWAALCQPKVFCNYIISALWETVREYQIIIIFFFYSHTLRLRNKVAMPG